MPTPTTHYGFEKPLINDPTDQDVWGGYLNADLDQIDALLFGLAPNTEAIVFSQSPYTISSTDKGSWLLVDTTLGNVVITLESSATAGAGFGLGVKKTDSSNNTVTITAQSGEFIDGAASLVLTQQYQAARLINNASTWGIVNAYTPSQVTPIQGSRKKFKAAWASNTTIATTADVVILSNGVSAYSAKAINSTLNLATVGANGLDAGSLAANTWYYRYLIYNGTTVASLASLSGTAPALPTGYTYSALVGTFLTDGTSNVIGFVQTNFDYQWIVGNNLSGPRLMANGQTTNAIVAVGVGSFVSPLATEINVYGMVLNGNGTNGGINIAPNSNYSFNTVSNPGGGNCPLSVYSTSLTTSVLGRLILESSNIYVCMVNANTNDNYAYCLGYTENF